MRTSRSTFWRAVATVFLTAVATIRLSAEHNPNVTSTRSGEGDIHYLMLQDGGLVEGKITPAAGWYIVARSGGQMQVPKSRVQFTCRTLDEAYAYRRQQINDPKSGPHMALAEWCLRYGLLTDAEHELAEARRFDSDQPGLALLERRLEK